MYEKSGWKDGVFRIGPLMAYERSEIVKISAILIMFSFASAAYAVDWVKYCSTNLVDAYYDRGSKTSNTVAVKWSYKSAPDSDAAKLNSYFMFRAYCSTRQLFNIKNDGAMEEVSVHPETIYEATWRLICGQE